MDMQQILDEIQNLIDKKVYFRAQDAFKKYIQESEENQFDFLPQLYYEYACFLFDLRTHDEAFMFFVKAYNAGFNKDIVLEIITKAFLEPNINSLAENYNSQTRAFCKSINIPLFKELRYVFIPYASGRYYLFDKIEQVFIKPFDTGNIKSLVLKNEGSDIVVLNENYYFPALFVTESKNIYFLDPSEQLYSYFMIPEIKQNNQIWIFENVELLQNHLHQNTFMPLPRNIIPLTEIANELEDFFSKEHSYRTTIEGRNEKGVLISFIMLTYNNANVAFNSIQEFIKSDFDCEIELIVCDNGSTEYLEKYREIENISDSRITYFRYEKQKPKGDILAYAISNKAKGKFACLMSDICTIINSSMNHYLSVLRREPDISVAHSFTNGMRKLDTKLFAKEQSLFNSIFGDYQFSGIIYNTQFFREFNISEATNELIADNNQAIIDYPQSAWNILMGFCGKHYTSNICLMRSYWNLQTKPEGSDRSPQEAAQKSVEDRFEQHRGYVKLIARLSKAQEVSEDNVKKLYDVLYKKTATLLYINKNQNLDISLDELNDSILKLFLEGAEELGVKKELSLYKILLKNINKG